MESPPAAARIESATEQFLPAAFSIVGVAEKIEIGMVDGLYLGKLREIYDARPI